MNAQRIWDKQVVGVRNKEWESNPPSKQFKAKNTNLMVLEEYPVGKDYGLDYWSRWTKRDYNPRKGSMVDHNMLRKIAEELNFKDLTKLDHICNMLENGAKLGVEAEGRWPSFEPNSKSIMEYGDRVADSLQMGILDGYIAGPFTKQEVDKIWPEGYKVSPIMVRLKPTGQARIIMDLSAPHGVELGHGEACSPNEGLSGFKEFEIVEMSSDKKFRRALYWAGWPAEVMKMDWSIAYKHVSVHESDHNLQLVSFGGRFFVELCLTFGCGTSPTHYNLIAKLLIQLAELKSGMDPRMNCQQLDDNCAAGPEGSQILRRYRKHYRDIAEKIGVKLAPEDDPSKAFPPSTEGEILGIIYNGKDWTWRIPEGKGLRLLTMIGNALRSGLILNQDASSLAGRINHYAIMVGGRTKRCLILHLHDESKAPLTEVIVRSQTKICLVWWLLNIRALQKFGRRIPNPDGALPSTAVTLHSDAAGGDSGKKSQGWGIVNTHNKQWARGDWPKYIRENNWFMGQRWGRKLSLLEGFAAVMSIPVWAAKIQRAGGAAILVDNIGFMWATHNGFSRDEHVWTLVNCLDSLARGLGVRIKVFHTRRRTNLGDQIADDLSKGVLSSLNDSLPGHIDLSSTASKTLLKWIERPMVKFELGRDVLLEVKASMCLDINVGPSYTTMSEEYTAV